MLIITKEHNYVKHICGVAFLFSAHRLMILYMGNHHKPEQQIIFWVIGYFTHQNNFNCVNTSQN